MKFSIIFFLLIALALTGCQSSPTEGNDFKSPRDYTWTADTLQFEEGWQTLMSSIWGSSAQDIYITGWNSSSSGSIYHFDGVQWEVAPFHEGAIDGAIHLKAVYGFGPNDVWFGGEEFYTDFSQSPAVDRDTAVVIHFNGVSWEQMTIHGRGERGVNIANIWGASPSDVWFAGYNAEVYHWNGDSIYRVPFSENIETGEGSMANWVTGNSSEEAYFTVGRRETGFPQSQLWRYANNTWEKLTEPGNDFNHIWMSPDNTLFAVGGDQRYFNGSDWTYTGFHSSYGINGPGDDNLMVNNPRDKRVYHHDGIDWQEIEELHFTDLSYVNDGIWYDGKEAFVVGWLGSKTVVFHGK